MKRGERTIDLGDPATQVELAAALEKVSEAAKKILNGPLTKRAVLVLIKDLCPQTGYSLSSIETVLEAAANLDQYVSRLQKKDAHE